MNRLAFFLLIATSVYAQVSVTVDPTTTFQTQKYNQIDVGVGPGGNCQGVIACNPDWATLIEAAHWSKLVNELGINTVNLPIQAIDVEGPSVTCTGYGVTSYFNAGVLGTSPAGCEHNYYHLHLPTPDGADTNHIRCNGVDYTFASALNGPGNLWKPSGANPICSEWFSGGATNAMVDYAMDNYYMGANGFRQTVINAGKTPHLEISINNNLLDFMTNSASSTAPQEWAKAMMALLIHLQNKYGVPAGLVGIVNEPDLNCDAVAMTGQNNSLGSPICQSGRGAGWYTPTTVANRVNALVSDLSTLISTNIVCCSTTNTDNAVASGSGVGWYDQVKAITGSGKINILGFHTYGGSLTTETAIGTRATADGIPALNTEYENIGIDNSTHNEMESLLFSNSVGAKKCDSSLPISAGNPNISGTICFLIIDSESTWQTGTGSPYSSHYVVGNESSFQANGPTWFFTQLFGYIPEGSVREKTTFSGPGVASGSVAYKAPDGTHRVVAIWGGTTAQTLSITGLPAGTYGCTYTTGQVPNLKVACPGGNKTIGTGGTLTFTPLTGVTQALGSTTIAVTVFGILGNIPPTQVFTKLVPTGGPGYTVDTIGQFDKAVWVPSRQCYSLWGEYKTATFSEENDALGCYSYVENRWHMLLQSSSQHSVHRPQTGHQWGDTTYVPATDTLYWTANSGAQGLEEMWAQYRFDMAGLTSSDIPLMSNSGVLSRQWVNGAQTLSGYEEWDSTNSLMVFFPDSSLSTGHVTTCILGSTMTCTPVAATGGPPATQASSNLRFDPDDGFTYWFGGGASVVYRLNAASPGTWQSFPNAQCTGADCVFTASPIGHPTIRYAAGFAYSTTDHKWLLIGGMSLPTSGTQFLDAWTFDPAANSGAGQWNEVCGSCGVAGTSYPTFTGARQGDRLVYNPTANVFLISDDSSVMWAFPLSTATQAYGSVLASYAPCSSTVSNCATGVVGPINRTLAPTTPSASYAQTSAFDLSVDTAGGALYLSRVESAIPGDVTSCLFPVPYIWSSIAGWLPGGTQDQACTAIGNGTLQQPSGHVYHTKFGAVEWETNERRNFGGSSSNGQVQAQSFNSGTQLWSGGNVGCITATCFSVGGTQPHNNVQGLINANGVLTALTLEYNSTFVQTGMVFVSQYNGTSWVSLTGTIPLNVLGNGTSGNFATYAAMAADPNGNLMICWTEELNPSRVTMSTTPQLECKYWNGTSMSVIGGGSLNVAAANWARAPSVVYTGTWYVGYTEQAKTGLPQLYVKSCPLSGACSLLGSALNHTPSTGLAYHPSLAANGATVVVGWEEQSAQGQHSLGYISRWTGSSWVSVASGFAADLTNGSIMDVGIAVPSSGTVMAGWTELTWGNLPQVYYQSFGINAPLSVPLTIQEALYPGSVAGITRTNEPVTVGVPIPDSLGLTSLASLGLTGAVTAGQFTTEGTYPSGNIKWVKVRAIVSSLTGGSTATMTLNNSGTGNFGGANLATDNGSTITVATGAATFTIKKANFNIFDVVQMGATTLVSSGSSAGWAIVGPNPTATYPANVTCAPTPGGSLCATLYLSSNDPNSTAVIEENGPAVCVLIVTGSFVDGAGNTYMHFTARMYFYQGSSKVKATVELRNADYGANTSNFATAFKGVQSFEARVAFANPTAAASLTYTIANHTATPTTGTLASTDGVYLYQAESTLMKVPSWCSGSGCVPYTGISGYSIMLNGSSVLNGTSAQYPQGWANISDPAGNGIEIGQYQFAAYGNKSLELLNGGTDLRLGIFAFENNTVGTSVVASQGVNNKPYYIPYPQYEINDIYFSFHTAAPASLPNDFLKQQHYLLARAPVAWYNTANAFTYPLLDPTEEDAFYSTVVSTASPAVSNYTYVDYGITNTQFPLTAWRFYTWPSPGASNQMEHHYSRMINFLRRGFTGDYLDTAQFYKMVAELGFARADGFSWTQKPTAETQYFNYPSVTYNNTGANTALGMKDWVELDQEHAHWYGMPDYYWVSGDETIKDFLIGAAKDHYLNAVSNNNQINSGKVWNSRAAGTIFMGLSRMNSFLTGIGDSAGATALLARGTTLWNTQIKPNLCTASGGTNYPLGCTPNTSGTDTNANQRGTSFVRGVTFQWGETSFDNTGCSVPPGVRVFPAFMAGILEQGLWEFRQAQGSSWVDYTNMFDTAYGISQAMFGEMYRDNGNSSWTGNGLIYKETIDFANTGCADYSVKNPDAYWPGYYLQYQYLGGGTSGWFSRLIRDVQGVYGVCTNACMDEMYGYTIGNLIYLNNHGNSSNPLATIPITSFTDNGSGSYTLGWATPLGTVGLRGKSGALAIVDYLGYNGGTSTFGPGNPATQQNWFASTEITNMPVPSPGSIQTVTVTGLATGLTAPNFMIKATTSGAVTPPNGQVILTKVLSSKLMRAQR